MICGLSCEDILPWNISVEMWLPVFMAKGSARPGFNLDRICKGTHRVTDFMPVVGRGYLIVGFGMTSAS